MIETKNCEIINIDKDFENAVQLAKRLYLEGKVFIYPTDTIYGIGANPFNLEAVERINKIKGRDLGKTPGFSACYLAKPRLSCFTLEIQYKKASGCANCFVQNTKRTVLYQIVR
jgi:tRNA A37 threonylcarbamoyladenosine synthetase subunit TsaC/SUA5/YrdC